MPLLVVLLALVEAERLLVHVGIKVSGLHVHLGSVQRALEETPEVLDALSMNPAPRVRLKVVHSFVKVGLFEASVRTK